MARLDNSRSEDLQRIIDSASRLGIEIEEEEAMQWLTSMAAFKGSSQISMDTRSGVFGHNITMLDFSDKELEYFKRVGKIVEFEDIPGKVETALALSGSSAQSKI